MSLSIDDLKKGLTFYEAARTQAAADIDFNTIVIDAINGKIAQLENEKEIKGEN